MMTEKLKFIAFVILITFLFVGIIFITHYNSKRYKYTIVDNNNHHYKTLEYEKIGDCVRFTEKSTNNVFEICGTYQIRENKNYIKQ